MQSAMVNDVLVAQHAPKGRLAVNNDTDATFRTKAGKSARETPSGVLLSGEFDGQMQGDGCGT